MRKGLLIASAALAALTAVPTMASARGGDYISATCWGDEATVAACDSTAARTAGPAVGDLIAFEFKTQYYDAANGTGPWLQLQCYRAGDVDFQYEGQYKGTLILADSRAGFPGGWGYGEPFVLEGTAWHEGPADCVTQVGHRTKSGKFQVDASTSYSVTG